MTCPTCGKAECGHFYVALDGGPAATIGGAADHALAAAALKATKIEGLDPGIADVVDGLRAAGFATSDSGDGWSKPYGRDVLPFAHVAVAWTGARQMTEVAIALLQELRAMGEQTASVQATFDPGDMSTVYLATWPGPRGQSVPPGDGG